jgi:hypothetical protein
MQYFKVSANPNAFKVSLTLHMDKQHIFPIMKFGEEGITFEKFYSAKYINRKDFHTTVSLGSHMSAPNFVPRAKKF